MKKLKTENAPKKQAIILRVKTDVKAGGYCKYMAPDWNAVSRCLASGGSW